MDDGTIAENPVEATAPRPPERGRRPREIVVASDVHVGDGGFRDSFSHPGSPRPEQFLAFLDWVGTLDAELIILGDLFEFWQANLSRVLTHPLSVEIAAKLDALEAVYILGNHDADLVGFVGTDFLCPPLFRRMSGPVFRIMGEKRFLFMHGHEVDPLNAPERPGWARMMSIFVGICEDKFGRPMQPRRPLVKAFARLGRWFLRAGAGTYGRIKNRHGGPRLGEGELTPSQDPQQARHMLRVYRALHEHPDAPDEWHTFDCLVTGHTHSPGRMNGWYYNSGSWSTTDNNFLRISPAGDVDVYDWNDGNPIPNNAVLRIP